MLIVFSVCKLFFFLLLHQISFIQTFTICDICIHVSAYKVCLCSRQPIAFMYVDCVEYVNVRFGSVFFFIIYFIRYQKADMQKIHTDPDDSAVHFIHASLFRLLFHSVSSTFSLAPTVGRFVLAFYTRLACHCRKRWCSLLLLLLLHSYPSMST